MVSFEKSRCTFRGVRAACTRVRVQPMCCFVDADEDGGGSSAPSASLILAAIPSMVSAQSRGSASAEMGGAASSAASVSAFSYGRVSNADFDSWNVCQPTALSPCTMPSMQENC